ncbi:energy-coupling factor ABC transporter permease [Marinobacterium arenosum]|uniref:energy-coupling factor ABC transporter permease n=1 Tax=Marinobacterium arenosum TaxID=2862496 RepID=UPI001C939587|nr:energy-coupling factor ABC transporter permease [Marinobacterium arenosum]MBY4676242.1 energy-coupling factor ABC transporter permease [Marinobacterium arenosum]
MSISEGLLTGPWLWLIHLLYLLALGAAVWRAPWRVLADNRRLQHLLFGATVLLMMMWWMRAGISPGLSIHFVGMTAMTLMFGWDLAILAASLALLGMTLTGKESWDGFTVNGLCSVVLPALVSYGIYRWVEWKLPKNFFIYLFLCAFIGGGIAGASAGLSSSLLLWLADVYSWAKIEHEYIRYLPLIMFPEGLMNGILMTGMMVFYPDWVRTFNAKAYIDDQ